MPFFCKEAPAQGSAGPWACLRNGTRIPLYCRQSAGAGRKLCGKAHGGPQALSQGANTHAGMSPTLAAMPASRSWHHHNSRSWSKGSPMLMLCGASKPGLQEHDMAHAPMCVLAGKLLASKTSSVPESSPQLVHLLLKNFTSFNEDDARLRRSRLGQLPEERTVFVTVTLASHDNQILYIQSLSSACQTGLGRMVQAGPELLQEGLRSQDVRMFAHSGRRARRVPANCEGEGHSMAQHAQLAEVHAWSPASRRTLCLWLGRKPAAGMTVGVMGERMVKEGVHPR